MTPTASGERDLALADVAIGYGKKRTGIIAAGLSARARAGEVTALIGPNGIGKSTLLRTITGLQPARAGEITLAGRSLRDLPARERATMQALVLTQRVNPGALTVRELTSLGRMPHTGFAGRLRTRDHDLIDAALEDVGIAALAGRDLSELSDGQRQRCMIARALAQDPRLLVLDEPTAFLDAPGRVSLAGLLRRLARERGIVVVTSTHDVELALRTVDQLWVMGAGEPLVSIAARDDAVGSLLGSVFDSRDMYFDHTSRTFILREAS